MLRCDGDIFLSGVRTPGHIQGHNMAVKGTLDLTDAQARSSLSEQHEIAAIAKHVDFTNSAIALLRLGGQRGHLSDKWGLERAEIKRLDVRTTFPKRVDLRQTDFARLTVNEGDHQAEITEFLILGDPFSSEPYAKVQTILRNQGRLREANNIYVAMMKKLGSVGGPGANPMVVRILYWVWGLVARFGVGWGRLAGMAIALCVLSVWLVTWNEQNWHSNAQPSWFFGAVVISVPVVEFIYKSILDQLKDSGPTQARVLWPRRKVGCQPGESCAIEWWSNWNIDAFAPRTAALALSAIGWIVWPLMLLVLTGFVRREH
jgi:hypothetical protein